MSETVAEVVSKLGERLQARGLRLCTAESCTGGGMAHAVTAVPGSSAWFECGWVTYSNASKTRLLGVDTNLIERWGAVSEPVAAAMARGALERGTADLSVAVTGVAGPGGGTPAKPVGLVWFAWARRDGACRTGHRVFPGDRTQVRDAAVLWGLWQLLENELAPG
jgi:nicotinamide-nucleotide amidase